MGWLIVSLVVIAIILSPMLWTIYKHITYEKLNNENS